MNLKSLLSPTVMLYACMCILKTDSVRIVGLFMLPDSNYRKGSQSND